MKKMTFAQITICLFAFCQVQLLSAQQIEPFPKVALSEYSLRDGLPNFMRKVAQGDTVKVAYLGGSITAQGGWRVNSMKYLRERFSTANFKEINAAIGGTGSDLGVLRIDYDVLGLEPDLVFVEFAVNDSGTDSLKIINAMEGIVRKIWTYDIDCDICFVYTFKADMVPDYEAGYHYYSSACMEQVADYYKIPSVFMGYESVELMKQGSLVIKRPKGFVSEVSGSRLNKEFDPEVESDGKIYFSGDGVHPYLNTGHMLYSKAVKRTIEAMIESDGGKQKARRALKKPLDERHHGNSEMVYLEDIDKKSRFVVLPKDNGTVKAFGSRFRSLWSAKSGATIEIRFKGSSLLAYDLLGPGGARLSVNVDGEAHFVDRFDGYCTYWRIGKVVLAEGLDPRKWHVVKIEVADDFPNKKEILFESNRKDYENNTSKYDQMNWYVGNFFVLH